MKVVKTTLFVLVLSVLTLKSYTQMLINNDSLFGNEWIDYDLTYHKVKVTEDGIYRLTYEALQEANIPVDQIPASYYQLFRLGESERIFISTEGVLSAGDYIEFYGVKNRSELDRHMFENPDEEMLNPEYSLVSDTTVYFLTWSADQSPNRFTQISNDLTNVPAARPWYMHSEKLVFSQSHYKPLINSQGVRFSHYVEGEGFSSNQNTQHNFSIPASQYQSEGPAPSIRFRMTGNAVEHNVSIQWNGSERLTMEVPGFNLARTGAPLIDSTVSLSASDITASNMFTAMTSGGTDRIRFSVVELGYPRAFIFENSTSVQLAIDDARDGAYLEVIAEAITDPIVYDLSSGDRIVGVVDQGTIKINLPAGPNTRQIILADASSGVMAPIIAKATEWTRLDASNANYIIISHPDLIDEGQNLYVADYAQYRQSAIGGNYQTQIIDIRQLVDQFAYGIHMHPLSIKNFVNFIDRNWSNPQYLFLIGKGLEYGQARLNEEPYEYLPVYGVPGSDNLLTSRGNSSVPRIPVGRLAVRTADQINIYLDKIKTMEDQIANAPQTIEDRGWMKRVLHLSGGNGNSEQALLQSNLASMANTLESSLFATSTTDFRIQTQDIIEGIPSEKVLSLFNSGVAIKTYFGHGSINITQLQGFEDPRFLNNIDRYPLMLALGCHTGNLFSKDFSLSEDNIFFEGKGAVIYLATSGLGFLNALDVFGNSWYESIGQEDYMESVGTSVQAVIRRNDSDQVSIKTLMQQLTLHGDPAYFFNQNESPDLTIDEETVKTSPNLLHVELDSAEISFDIVNLGKNTSDSIPIDIELKNSQGQTLFDNTLLIKSLGSFRKTVSLKVPIEKNWAGLNRLHVELNKDGSIDEKPVAEATSNNILRLGSESGIPFFISESGISPLYPTEFAIVDTTVITLYANSTFNEENESQFVFEIDTTKEFNSGLLQSSTINSRGGILSFSNYENLLPETVYYWRVGKKEISDSIQWQSSSFQIGNRKGWGQAHYFQFLENELTDLELNPITRLHDFRGKQRTLRIFNKVPDEVSSPDAFLDGQRIMSPFAFVKEGIYVQIIDDQTGLYWRNTPEGLYGSIASNKSGLSTFAFETKSLEQRANLLDFLTNTIPDNHYVVIYTVFEDESQDLAIGEWAADSTILDETIFDFLEAQGSNLYRTLEENGARPFVFAFQKNLKPINETIASSIGDIADLSFSYTQPEVAGSLETPWIGPAISWSQLEVNLLTPGPSDEINFEVFGMSQEGSIERIMSFPFAETLDLTSISASRYPYIRLRISLRDEVDKTVPNLHKILVYYEPSADLLFDPGESFQVEDTLTSQNTDHSVEIAISNISNYSSDSTTLKLTYQDALNRSTSNTLKIPSLSPFKTTRVQGNTDISELRGNTNLLLEINPDRDFIEQSFSNNLLSKEILIKGDKTNPLLDVYFDGLRILDGDIVSPEPRITLQLRDESTTTLLDSSSLQVRISQADRLNDLREIDPSQFVVEKRPSQDENQIVVTLSESFPTTGIYKLVANGTDAENNKAGENDYEITFNVITENTVSQVLPYPNPFSDQTRFLYTLTGSIPDIFTIQIYTSNGIVVREITKEELGELRIGTHLTEFMWDGTDSFGDKLANGVYFYRVRVSNDEGQYENFDLETDRFFEKKIGKIVLLR